MVGFGGHSPSSPPPNHHQWFCLILYSIFDFSKLNFLIFKIYKSYKSINPYKGLKPAREMDDRHVASPKPPLLRVLRYFTPPTLTVDTVHVITCSYYDF